jgi:hypothetical protein
VPLWVWIAIAAAAFAAFVVWLRSGGAPPAGATSPRPADDDAGPATGLGRGGEGLVLLAGNAWDDCAIDGLREPWGRFTAAPTEGIASVPSGRHRVATRTDAGEAVLDFTLHAGDVLVRRLDAATARWERESPEAEARARARADGGALGAMRECLLSYKTAVGMARVAQGTVRAPDAALAQALAAAAPLYDRAARGDAAAVVEARAVGETLVGVPLSEAQLAKVCDAALARAETARAKANAAGADAILDVALALLPGEPSLARARRESV